jgi:hypothetical protein
MQARSPKPEAPFPARKKSVLVRMARLSAMPTPSTATKYTAMIA